MNHGGRANTKLPPLTWPPCFLLSFFFSSFFLICEYYFRSHRRFRAASATFSGLAGRARFPAARLLFDTCVYRKCEKTTKSIRTEHVRRDNRSRVYKKTAIYCIDEWLNRRVDASLQTALNAPVKMVSFGKSEIPPAIQIYGLIPISMEPCAPDTRKTRRQTPSVKNVILKWWLAVDY